jgi:putative acetyltransferase
MPSIITSIHPEHDQDICHIIRQVGAEFGASGEGFGPADPEVLCMSQHYSDRNCSIYMIALVSGQVVGGCGIAPFNGSQEVCELRKLFLLPEVRGQGIGKKLVIQCLDYARSRQYKQCYLDTLTSMNKAVALYKKLGFNTLDHPLDGAIHHGCDIWMIKALT